MYSRLPLRGRALYRPDDCTAGEACEAEAMSTVGWEIVNPPYYERYGYHASRAFLRKPGLQRRSHGD
jgi:hypothetical protein